MMPDPARAVKAPALVSPLEGGYSTPYEFHPFFRVPKTPLLQIKSLTAALDGTKILHGIDLVVKPGELHVVMGPNGGGKSTLVRALMGHPSVTVTRGTMTLDGKNIKKM